jgi:glycyl-tRNA synthetase beta chain
MGMHYARPVHGDLVALAIAEHYMPKGAGGALPSTAEGALVAIADRMDTLVGCFAASLEPTGSADPYGLRRAAIGVLQILLGRPDWTLTIDELIETAANGYSGALDVTETDCGELSEFFRGRLRGILIDEGLASADVDAALGVPERWGNVCDARARAQALAVLPTAAREVFKRIANILDDADAKGIDRSGAVDESLLNHSSEKALWSAYKSRHSAIGDAFARLDYRGLFSVLVDLQPAVAAFFDKGGVMVMDPDPTLRRNRLALLAQIRDEFAQIADFRAVAAASGGAES